MYFVGVLLLIVGVFGLVVSTGLTLAIVFDMEPISFDGIDRWKLLLCA